jgi:hypothetical protein
MAGLGQGRQVSTGLGGRMLAQASDEHERQGMMVGGYIRVVICS